MISVLIDAAFRSLFVGLMVAAGMRVFRIRNVFARKAAMGLVLAGALAMPLLLQVTDRFGLLPRNASIVLPAHSMTLLEELQAKLQARSGSARIPKLVAEPLPAPVPASAETPLSHSPDHARVLHIRDSRVSSPQPAPVRKEFVRENSPAGDRVQPPAQPTRAKFSTTTVALSIYLAVAGVLLLRLVLGLAITLRLWFNAKPIRHGLFEISARPRLRASSEVSSPLTIGSAILLPADYETWDQEKFRIVLAHEHSHIRQFDFYLQLLAGLYAALVWFSPLGWWLKRELADLAEAISDRAGIDEARSRTSYAQILLEFAAAPRTTALGVAMARPGSLSRRIERLLNEHTFHQSFAGGRRALFAFVLVPVVLFAGTAVVRVHAAVQAGRIAWIAPAVPSHAPLQASENVSADRVDIIPTEDAESDPFEIATAPDASATLSASPEAETAAIAAPEIAAAQTAPNLLPIPAVPRAIAGQSETGGPLSFNRTLTVSGEGQLYVVTGSGNIHLTRSSGNQIRIIGKIKVSHHGSEEQARQIAANPPIEQTGDVIRVGQQHEEHWRGISIDYDIEAPAGTVLAATSGSGDVVDEGVGKNAKLQTGSGDIRAKGLDGQFEVQTGSGNITAEQIGQGDVKAQTGSGDIEIKDVHGSFNAQTGSGDIKATGTPSAPWTLKTGSGNIEIWTSNAPIALDASTGSGSVTSDREMLIKGSLNHHHITGNLNGGGPLVRMSTGSGDIQVH